MNQSREKVEFILLLAAALLIGGWGITSRPLYDPDEGRYAEIAREMWERGDWIVPRLDGIPYVDKPPLLMWLTAPLMGLLGPGELAPRLVPFGASLAILLMLYFSARRRFGHPTGLWAATAWVTALLPLGMTRGVSTDMLLAAFTTGSVLCFWRALEEDGCRALLGWALAGLAFMTKGPVGFLIPAMAGVGYAAAYRRLPWRNLRLLIGIPICLAVAAPWFAAIEHVIPKFHERFFFNQNVEGFLSPKVHHGHPFYHTILYMLGGMLPWTMLLIPAGIRDRAFWKYPAVQFLLLWAAAIVLFFTISAAKLITYVIPACPPLALAGGMLLARASGNKWDAAPYASIAVGSAAVCALFFLIPSIPTHYRDIPIPRTPAVAGAIGVGLCMTVAAVLAARGRPRGAAACTFFSSVAFIIPTIVGLRNSVDDFRSARTIVERNREIIASSDLVQFHNLEYSILYYARKPVYMRNVPNEMEWGEGRERSPLVLGEQGGLAEFMKTRARVAVFILPGDMRLLEGMTGLVELDRTDGFVLFVKKSP